MAQHAQGPEQTSGAPEDPAELIKRRMREALDRKNQQQHATAETESRGDAVQKGMHGVATPHDNQTYRRKSGGGGA